LVETIGGGLRQNWIAREGNYSVSGGAVELTEARTGTPTQKYKEESKKNHGTGKKKRLQKNLKRNPSDRAAIGRRKE